MTLIHPSAIVSKKAKLAENVEVGPCAVIDDFVTIGAGTKIGAHCVITGHTSIGKENNIFSSAVVGSAPQDMKFKGEKSFLEIGDHNIIREFCTMNPGTGENGRTRIGSHNLFMAYAHVAHDCLIGNHNIFVNGGTLGGHVVVEDHILVSGLVAVHQFVRIGKLAIIGGCSKVVQDVPPFCTADGHPARIFGLNLVGLKRNNVERKIVKELDQAFKILFDSGTALKKGIEKLAENKSSCAEVAYLINWLKNSPRGVIRSCRSNGFSEE
ncbi:MAG: acyl-ACP--UDP-N-acetylglucosamine O-acyltransferase [Candidatus Omnitrophica bacterium]|nr:acyl-ACP--UDP-N-acetylglucosamine O-acyltransferase [Candidatus Omnitrophota bacterium]